MDEQTALVLGVQLTALCCIAGSLLLYLLCKVKKGPWTDLAEPEVGTGRSVLVTSVENHLGMQLALRLAALGFRVFGGLRDGDLESDPAKVIKAKMKQIETAPASGLIGAIILIPLDVTREDSLHEGVEHIRRHLPAGENGLWAVVNTAGAVVKGRLEAQESYQWESMFKVNVVGTLRTARSLLPLLKVTKGRLVTVGLSGECHNSTGVVAYAAARHAVAGASTALANEFLPLGVSVIIINTGTLTSEHLYRSVKVRLDQGENSLDAYLKYNVNTLPEYAASTIEQTLLVARPKQTYDLKPPVKLSNYLTAVTAKFNHGFKQKGSVSTV
ncbi:corticosteroid 11-beta-dehydrogenase isozyme 2 [Cimex lectularius]|uniref:Uncharacterized protein n=1 Tax=Cimex lectularius TaxID=79782 RepID=A0A8I6RDG1_CIMLE|nr:corticosteroid 11-beta-dehydrogenase isozyme 2 [Cimex lectularius]